MITAIDIYTPQKQLLIKADTKLTAVNISHIEFYSIKSVTVYDQPDNDEPVKVKTVEKPIEVKSGRSVFQGILKNMSAPKTDAVASEVMASSKKIKTSPVFQKYQVNYIINSEKFKSNFNNLIKNNGQINTSFFLQDIKTLIPDKSTPLGVFDMLNNMRNYDDVTYLHSQNVALICNAMGQWLHLPKEDLDVLTLCGLFHDIGKIFVPEQIISKIDTLTPNEKAIIESHTILGYNFLKDKSIDERIKQAALNHHERANGGGYPSKLKNSQIDDFSKIVAIADVYDAMTSQRKYRKPICPFKVIEEMEKEGLQKYDANYLLLFLEKITNTFVNDWVMLSNGQTGYIIMINKNSLAKPVIKINEEYVDLSKLSNVFIKSML